MIKKVENLELHFIDLLKKVEAVVLSQIADRCKISEIPPNYW